MMFKNYSLKAIKESLERLGVSIPEEKFNELSYSQIKTISMKAGKAFRLYEEIDEIVKSASMVKPPLSED